jgi:hypothetical protein
MKVGSRLRLGVAVLAALLPWETVAAPIKELRLWETIEPLAENGRGDGLVRLNKDVLKKIKKGVRKWGQSPPLIIEILPNVVLECTLSNFDGLMSPALAAKYPEIMALSGSCTDGATTVTLSVNDNDGEKTASVNIHYQGNRDSMLLYADYREDMSNGDPKVLHLRLPQLDGPGDWSDSVIESELLPGQSARSLLRNGAQGGRVGNETRRLNPTLPATAPLARKYRLAVATTKEYSDKRGKNRAAVMSSIVKSMARVNGIFLKEMGIMFELITDALICLEDEADCDDLPNDRTVFGTRIMKHYNDREVGFGDFDLGHIFTNLNGGVARRPAVCYNDNKYDGITGIGTEYSYTNSAGELVVVPDGWIKGERFDIVLTHEIGHQLYAPHSCKRHFFLLFSYRKAP